MNTAKAIYYEMKNLNGKTKTIIKLGLIAAIAIYIISVVLYILAGRMIDYHLAMTISESLALFVRKCLGILLIGSLCYEVAATRKKNE